MAGEQLFYNRPTFPAQLNMAHPLTRGLVGCWVLNEDAPNSMRAWDSSPYQRHGTVTGALGRWQGRTLNGTTDWISIPTITLADDTPWTVAWWMYPQVDIATNTVIGEALGVARFEHREETSLSYYNGAGFVGTKALGSSILNRWIFMVASSDGTTLTLYKDTVSRGTWSPASVDMTLTGIGRGDAGVNYGQGIYGVFWVWNNRALTAVGNRELYLDPYGMFLR